MLWPCQMSMLDLKFTPIELLDHEGRTCLGCSSQFGPACHLNNKLQQCLSKHEENSLYLAQIPVIFWLWTRSANDQSNDTVERQRLFCFVREAHWTHIYFFYIGHILTGSHFVPLQCHTWEVVLHLSCGFSFFLEIRVSKTATLLFCDLKYCLQWKQNRAMKARSQLWRCPLDRQVWHNSWCHHMMPVV